MPLQITGDDLAKIRCDAIVNPTDPLYSGSGGADRAIHQGAGPAMRAACAELAPLEPGGIAVTEGFRLPCRYVLHTVGPVWHGGAENEEALLRACYVNALLKAAELALGSVAFPLISSGAFGFPKEKVLRIADTAIRDMLRLPGFEMDVTLCIRDTAAYEVALHRELARYLDKNALPPVRSRPVLLSGAPLRGRPRAGGIPRKAAAGEEEEVLYECSAAAPCAAAPADIDDWLKQQDDTFAVTLLKLIDKKHMTDVQCYKKANISKKTFWKINNDPKYRPSKPTVLAFAIALELTLTETEALLKTVGFSLSHSSTFDMIIEFYIRNGQYDIFEINAALYKYDQLCLGC